MGGAYAGIEETLEDSLAAELLLDTLRGTGFGTMAVVNGLGDLVSSIAVGWLWATFGPAAGFGFALMLMSAGALVVWVTRNHSTATDLTTFERIFAGSPFTLRCLLTSRKKIFGVATHALLLCLN